VGGVLLSWLLFSNNQRLGHGLRAAQASRTKNIKIAKKDIFSFEFFAPFNSLFLEQEKKEKCLKNQRLMKNLRPESISGLLAELSLRFYDTLFSLFSVS